VYSFVPHLGFTAPFWQNSVEVYVSLAAPQSSSTTPFWQNCSAGANGLSAPHIARSSVSTSPLGQTLSPFAGVVPLAGVFISQSPQTSWAIASVSVFVMPLVQLLVFEPSASQVAGVIAHSLQEVHSVETEGEESALPLELETSEEDKPSEDEEPPLLLPPSDEDEPPPSPDEDIPSGVPPPSSPEQEKVKAIASTKPAVSASLYRVIIMNLLVGNCLS
jgi:hypothetical protein